MKYLIAGLGSVGRRHMRNLVALGEMDIVLYRTHKATLPDDELAGYPVETDLAEALKRHKPDAVIISNPTSLHLDVAIPAAEAGCAILLDFVGEAYCCFDGAVGCFTSCCKKERLESVSRVSVPFSSGHGQDQAVDRKRRDRACGLCECPFWRVFTGMASVGGLSQRLGGSLRHGRRCGGDTVSFARLSAVAGGEKG
ncbi:MAG: Gfo/Idh/MocA family oxidoreductase [Chloroflexi bacterium]|nr:Gfo/Idh/MocA family oxidoreductase [Chloroflexota bacterium]